MGQVQANDLASIEGYNYHQILSYFYGSDIEGFQFPTFRFPVPSEKYKVHADAGFYDPEYLKNFGVNHLGEDIPLEEKTPIRAIADGKIVQYEYHSGYASWDDGTSIAAVIEHDLSQTITLTLNKGDKKTVSVNKICSIYGHIRKSEEYSGDKIPWKIGDPIKKGDIIGYINDKNHNGVGNEHLHFGIRLSGHPDPDAWVYYGRESADIPESNVKHFVAPSEIIPKLDIFAGIQYLRSTQNPEGSWTGLYGKNIGYTSLAALAFLNHGIDESDPTVSKAINYILSNKHPDGSIYVSYSNYETALAILPLVATHNSDYDDEIAAARDFLVDIQNDEGEGLTNSDWPYGGWGYGWLDPSWADLSNTQWTLMGLDAADLPAMSDTWSKGELYVTRCQNLQATNPEYDVTNDGGFTYQPPTISGYWGCNGDPKQSYGAMTAAGVWSHRLCGVDTSDQRVQVGLNWLRNNYAPIDTIGNPCHGDTYLYYYLLSFAKTLIMTGIPAGSWQETASQDITNYIVTQQYDDGHWSSDEGDLFATEQAILALQTRMIPTDIQRLSYLTFILHSNADLHVYDPLGRHVGMNYTTGEIEIQIPNATYTSNGAQNITIPGLETGNYRIILVGTGEGEYTLNVTGGVGNDTVSEDSYTGNITEGEVHDSTVNVAMITWLTIHVDEPEPTLITDLTNVRIIDMDPTVTSINVTSLNLSEINETYKPESSTSQSAYMINSSGAGNFTLRFTNITNANTIIVYKLNATNYWIELDTTTTTDNVTFTMSVGDPPVVFASGAFTTSIDLYTGWNLISVPLNLSSWVLGNESAVGDPLNVTPKNSLTSIYRYSTTTGLFEKCDHLDDWGWWPATGAESFTNVELGRGYWVWAKNDCNLTFTGTAPSDQEISLDTNWNLIGWYSLEEALLGEESVVGNPLNVTPKNSLTSIYRYNATKGKFEKCDHLDDWGWWPATGAEWFTDLESYSGYWVSAEDACVWRHVV